MLSYFMGCIALVRRVLVLRCGLAGVVWYPYAGFSCSPVRGQHSLLFNACCIFFLELKAIGCDSEGSPQSGRDVKNEWICNSTPPINFKTSTWTYLPSGLAVFLHSASRERAHHDPPRYRYYFRLLIIQPSVVSFCAGLLQITYWCSVPTDSSGLSLKTLGLISLIL